MRRLVHLAHACSCACECVRVLVCVRSGGSEKPADAGRRAGSHVERWGVCAILWKCVNECVCGAMMTPDPTWPTIDTPDEDPPMIMV